jgi:hypothetical protein
MKWDIILYIILYYIIYSIILYIILYIMLYIILYYVIICYIIIIICYILCYILYVMILYYILYIIYYILYIIYYIIYSIILYIILYIIISSYYIILLYKMTIDHGQDFCQCKDGYLLVEKRCTLAMDALAMLPWESRWPKICFLRHVSIKNACIHLHISTYDYIWTWLDMSVPHNMPNKLPATILSLFVEPPVDVCWWMYAFLMINHLIDPHLDHKIT